MPVYFRRFNAKISKMIGLSMLFAAFLAIGDGYYAAIPFFAAGGLILITRNAANNGGIRGTAVEIFGVVLALIGAGIVWS